MPKYIIPATEVPTLAELLKEKKVTIKSYVISTRGYHIVETDKSIRELSKYKA